MWFARSGDLRLLDCEEFFFVVERSDLIATRTSDEISRHFITTLGAGDYQHSTRKKGRLRAGTLRSSENAAEPSLTRGMKVSKLIKIPRVQAISVRQNKINSYTFIRSIPHVSTKQ